MIPSRKHAIFCFAVLAFALGSNADYDEDDIETEEIDRSYEAQLLVRKVVAEDVLVEFSNITVTYGIFNTGGSAAFSVDLTDASWGDMYEVVEGETSQSWNRIAAGASVNHTIIVKPKYAGPLINQPAKVTYRPTGDTDETQVVGSSLPVGKVLSSAEKYMKMALQVGKYVTLGFVRTEGEWKVFGSLSAVLFALFTGNTMALKGKAWHKDRQSRIAMEALGVSDQSK